MMYFVAAILVSMTVFLVIYEELEPAKKVLKEKATPQGGISKKHRTPPYLQDYPALNT